MGVINLYAISASIKSFIDAEVSSSRARVEITESETLADELAFQDEEMATSFRGKHYERCTNICLAVPLIVVLPLRPIIKNGLPQQDWFSRARVLLHEIWRCYLKIAS